MRSGRRCLCRRGIRPARGLLPPLKAMAVLTLPPTKVVEDADGDGNAICFEKLSVDVCRGIHRCPLKYESIGCSAVLGEAIGRLGNPNLVSTGQCRDATICWIMAERL